MKPFGVLILVLVAVGGLFFAINQLGGDNSNDVLTGPDVTVPEPKKGGPETLPANSTLTPASQGERDEVSSSPSLREDANPVSAETFENSLRGTVVNSAQQPVADAKVVLTRSGLSGQIFVNEKLDRSQDRFATTDKSGAYAFFNVQPFNAYAVEIKSEGYSQASMAGIVVDTTGNTIVPVIVLGAGSVLTGRVTDTAGNAVPEALLTLEGLFSQLDGTPSPDSLSTRSDANGNYTIANVPPGARKLQIKADGYANQEKGGLVFRDEAPLQMDVTLELAEMICGRVINKRGVGVAGANVLAMSYNSSNRTCREFGTADENGEFCLTSLATGKYTISVTAPGYRAKNENRVDTGGAGLIVEMEDQGMVSGKVTGPDGGAPPVPYKLQLRRTFEAQTVTSKVGNEVAFENPDGSFNIECTQSATYVVEAVAPGFAPSFSEEFRFTLGQPLNGISVRLTKGGGIIGRVVDGEGKPVQRPHITTHDNTWSNNLFDQALGDQFPSNVTKTSIAGNNDGRFALDNLRSETYQLSIRAAGFCEQTLKDVLVTEGRPTDVGAITLIRGGSITGTVIDPAGQPIVGAAVRIDPSGNGPDSGPVDYKTQSGAGGAFSFANVHPGTYRLSASVTVDPLDFLRQVSNEQNNVQELRVKNGDTLRFELRVAN